MTSVERIMAYTGLNSEPGYKTKSRPPINWPSDGHLSFRNVALRYYPGGPQVLKNLSFQIPGKKKVGIVGRTGDGKSSIVGALLRMPEADGEIHIDNVPIKSIQLQVFLSLANHLFSLVDRFEGISIHWRNTEMTSFGMFFKK